MAAPPTQHQIESGGASLSAQEAGEGQAVVLLHGLTATRRYVVMGSTALERGGHRVISYDARGHGRSSPAPDARAYGYERLAGDLEAVLDDLGVERSLLAGASMGAHTALRLALERPERVTGLALITPAFDPRRSDEVQSMSRWDALADGLRRDGIEGFLEAYSAPGLPAGLRDTLLRVARQRLGEHENLSAVADALNFVPRSRPFDSLGDLARLRMPTVVVGSRDESDPGHPLSVARAYVAAIPGARLVVEEDGQSPLAWQGGQLSGLIAELAARV